MAEKYVKFLMIEFPVLVPDPWNPEEGDKVPAMRTARHGQKVSTETDPAEPEANVVYGLQDYDLQRLEEMGAFFTDLEYALFEAGVSNSDVPLEGGAVRIGDTTASPAFGADLAPIPHPVAFSELSIEQLAQAIKDDNLDAGELVEEVYADPSLAEKVLAAEDLATQGSPREEVIAGVSEAVQAANPQPEPIEDDESDDAGSGPPAASASRGEWDAYAESIGLDPSEYSSKDEVRAAVEEIED